MTFCVCVCVFVVVFFSFPPPPQVCRGVVVTRGWSSVGRTSDCHVWFPGAVRGFLSEVSLWCRLSIGVRTPLGAIACINICAHDKDHVVHVRVRWIMATQTHTACIIGTKLSTWLLWSLNRKKKCFLWFCKLTEELLWLVFPLVLQVAIIYILILIMHASEAYG